jgi:chitin disaccharide deacetylase
MIGERRLIVNADGYGFGDGATRGVTDAIEGGRVITSISVNANFSAVHHLPGFLDRHPQISVGVHLNPLAGRPCLPADRVSSLVRSDGYFHEGEFFGRLSAGAVDMGELRAEFEAQIETVAALAGTRLTHLDSQAHSHLRYFDLFLDLARKWRIQRIRTNASMICLEALRPGLTRTLAYVARPHVWAVHQYRKWQMRRAHRAGLRTADALVTVGYAGTGNKTNLENWRRILQNLPRGTFEIFCHPAYPDDTLRRWSTYHEPRAREFTVLRDGHLRELAERLGIKLISFSEV